MHLPSGIAAVWAAILFYPAVSTAQTYTECNPITSGETLTPSFPRRVIMLTRLKVAARQTQL